MMQGKGSRDSDPLTCLVLYGMVTLFTHGISFRYIYIQIEKTNYLTKLESKVKDWNNYDEKKTSAFQGGRV